MKTGWICSVSAVLALTPLIAVGNASADEIADFNRFVAQYEQMHTLSTEVEITREMRIRIRQGGSTVAKSMGTARFFSSGDLFRIETEIVGVDELGQEMAQRGIYNFDGKSYVAHFPDLSVNQQMTLEPDAGVEFPTNPVLFPVLFLRNDLDSLQLKGIRHFRDQGLMDENIASKELGIARGNHAYVRITLKPERNREHIPDTNQHYRVFLRMFDGVDAAYALPYLVQIWQNGRPMATVSIEHYLSIHGNHDTLYLPAQIALWIAGDDQTTLTINAQVASLSIDSIPASVFNSPMPDAATTINTSAGTVDLAEGLLTCRSETSQALPALEGDETVSKKKRSTTGLIALIAAIGFIAWILHARFSAKAA